MTIEERLYQRDEERRRMNEAPDAVLLANQLADLYSARDALRMEKEALLNGVLTPEIKKQIEEIELEFAPNQAELDDKIDEAEAGVRVAVLIQGMTATGEHLQAVYVKPRVTWDTHQLEGYAKAHPEILAFRNEGTPSVSFRRK